MEIKVVYKIKESTSWRSEEGIDIESNIANDKLIDCQIAESLVNKIKKDATLLDSDKLLLSFAEAQTRGIKDNLSALTDLELSAKNHADSVQASLLKSMDNHEEQYEELYKKFSSITEKFNKGINKSAEKINESIASIKTVEEQVSKLNSYKLDSLMSTLENLSSLVDRDSDLVKLVLAYKVENLSNAS